MVGWINKSQNRRESWELEKQFQMTNISRKMTWLLFSGRILIKVFGKWKSKLLNKTALIFWMICFFFFFIYFTFCTFSCIEWCSDRTRNDSCRYLASYRVSLFLGIRIQLYFGVLEHHQIAFEWVCHPHYLIYYFIM